MITFYLLDENNVYTGQTVEKSKYEPWGNREIKIAPPSGEFVRWNGSDWVVLEAYPTPFIDMEVLKASKKVEIKQAFTEASASPIVDTGLGFSVDGAYKNKTDFETGKKYGFPQVRASDNTMHAVLNSDYDIIISAIEMNGIALYQRKWELEALIDAATNLQELEAITW